MGSEARVKLDELSTDVLRVKGLEFTIGKIIEEWEEAPGPTPMPAIETLREWDLKLLKKYRPFYLPFCDLCCLCTMGKCDLTKGKRGACGIDIATQQSRFDVITASTGTAAHCTHARDLVDLLIEKYGRDHPIDVGGVNVELEAPNIRLVTGIKPTKLGDLEHALEYCESQIVQLLASTHIGQEGDNLDYESKIFHAGMIDHVAQEIADTAQISTYNFPKADPQAPLAEIGMGSVDSSKPVILVIGHNAPSAIEITNRLKKEGLEDKVELCGLCCTAHDASRHHSKIKIVGPMSWQLRFIRSGIPDVIVIDMQCIRTDTLAEAQKIKAPLITTSSQDIQGLPNLSQTPVGEIVKGIVDGGWPGAFISDPDKTGEVVVKLAMEIAPKRKKFKTIPSDKEIIEASKKCTLCDLCRRACPNDLPIPEALEAAGKGDLQKLVELYDSCIGCGRCEMACPTLTPFTYILGASKLKITKEKSKMRVGRGAIQDIEIRRVGYPIVVGEIPGVLAFVGCSNYRDSWKAVGDMVNEFAKRRYISTTSGCAAMAIALNRDEDGTGPYEKYSGVFEAGGLVNVGSCVANSHISGAAIKIASIFAKRKLRSNYEEIADYIHNRVGAVGVVWGGYSQKAFAIAAGFWRLGVPVIFGPHGAKYRRVLLGRKNRDEDWYVIDARTGKQVYVGPTPEHLFCVAETKEEAMVMIPKLCMRPSDTTRGRSIKLTNYIDLHRKFYGTMPDDIHLFVRSTSDIPITMKDEVTDFLKQKGWAEREIPDPTLLPRLVRVKKG